MGYIKRTTALLLAVLMTFTLAACSAVIENKSQDVSGSVKMLTEAETAEISETFQETEAVQISETIEDTEIVQDTEAAEGIETDQKELKLGSVTGNVYENTYFGIGCSLDENWVYADEDELADMIGMSVEMFDDEEIGEQILKADMFYDMFASADNGAVNIVISVENLGALYGMALDEESYIDAALVSLEDVMASANVTVKDFEKTTLTFAGKDHVAVRMYSVNENYNNDVYQLLVCIKQGSYIALITMSSSAYDVTESMTDLFYKVE